MEVEESHHLDMQTVELRDILCELAQSLGFGIAIALFTLKNIVSGLIDVLRQFTCVVVFAVHQISLGLIAVLHILVHGVTTVYPVNIIAGYINVSIFGTVLSNIKWCVSCRWISVRQALTCELGGVTVRNAPLCTRWMCRICADLIQLLAGAVLSRHLPAPITRFGLLKD